jgi:NAD-dependent deacetylase
MKTIEPKRGDDDLAELGKVFRDARKMVALSGAGISVASGISDFRSPGGLWSIFNPDAYATLSVFQQNPEKAWELYRALGRELLGKKPNPAHRALAELESVGLLSGVVTQNVDNLHQQAGSRTVLEIHGDHQHLQCLKCGWIEPVTPEHYEMEDIPQCDGCSYPLKPNVVLFGEPVRHLAEIDHLIARCDLLLVIGTSAQVYPAASLPHAVHQSGGTIVEFNHEQALAADQFGGNTSITDFFVKGDVAVTLPLVAAEIAAR